MTPQTPHDHLQAAITRKKKTPISHPTKMDIAVIQSIAESLEHLMESSDPELSESGFKILQWWQVETSDKLNMAIIPAS